MKKVQKDVSPLRWIEVFKETYAIYDAHGKVFNLIFVTITLPLAILLLVALFFTYRNLPQPFMPSQEAFDVTELLICYFGSLREGSPGLALDTVRLLLAWAVGTILFQGALGLLLSATLYAVKLHYAGQPFSFLDLLRASTPYFWIRVALTNAYCYVLLFSILLGQTVGVILLVQSKVATLWLVFGVTALVGLSLVVEFFLGIIFTIASGMAVLDEDYGWAAVNKSLKLLKGKWKVAVFFQLHWSAVGFVYLLLQGSVRSLSIRGDVSSDFQEWAVVVIAKFFFWSFFTWQFRALFTGVQYMAFKTHQNEKLADFLDEEQALEGKCERLGDGA